MKFLIRSFFLISNLFLAPIAQANLHDLPIELRQILLSQLDARSRARFLLAGKTTHLLYGKKITENLNLRLKMLQQLTVDQKFEELARIINLTPFDPLIQHSIYQQIYGLVDDSIDKTAFLINQWISSAELCPETKVKVLKLILDLKPEVRAKLLENFIYYQTINKDLEDRIEDSLENDSKEMVATKIYHEFQTSGKYWKGVEEKFENTGWNSEIKDTLQNAVDEHDVPPYTQIRVIRLLLHSNDLEFREKCIMNIYYHWTLTPSAKRLLLDFHN